MKKVNDKVYLLPGELYITSSPEVIWTVLGSCISIILFHEPTGLSAINHAQLPEKKTDDVKCINQCPGCLSHIKDFYMSDNFKYVSCSFKFMLSKFISRNISPGQIEAQVYGGASIFNHISTKDKTTIGKKNSDLAIQLIHDNHIFLKNKNIGGIKSRRLLYHTATNKVEIIFD